MSAVENKQLLQQIFAEMSQGNSKPLVDAMADDFRWTVIGSTRWSRSYDGKETVLKELFAPLRNTLEGKISTTAVRLIAEDDLVVVEARGNNITRTGKPYKNTYCFVVRVTGGKLQELTEYCDTALVTSALGDPAA
jgi:ketosteroid isomerase-like protein